MIEIIKPGSFSTIQDLGRPSGSAYGYPWCGAMDRNSLRLSNTLVGNNESEAVLEITISGPTLKFHTSGMFAITGAELNAELNGNLINNNERTLFKTNDILKLGNATKGCRAYISFYGGIDVPLVVGSRSTYTYAQIGGLHGRALQKGDRLEIKQPVYSPNSNELKPTPLQTNTFRVIRGPEFTWFGLKSTADFLGQKYSINSKSNRMGYQLNGPKLKSNRGYDILSSGTIRGTVQVAQSGEPMILMADSPTTGGYPRLANIVDEDVDKLAQLKPGDTLQFELVKANFS